MNLSLNGIVNMRRYHIPSRSIHVSQLLREIVCGKEAYTLFMKLTFNNNCQYSTLVL